MNTEVQLKKCTTCGHIKPATAEYFYPHKLCKDGLRGQCKLCVNARTNKWYEKKVKPIDYNHRNADIYRTYYRTACNNPVKQHMLAQFYDITLTELKQIIKTEDEKQMHKKWTDEMNAELLANASLPGATNQSLAEMYGTSVANIAWRVSMLRKASNTTVNEPTPLEVIDPVATYGDTEPIQDEPVKGLYTKEAYDELHPITATPIPAVNQQIAKLCETPEPSKPKPDYTESPLETLREAEEFREPVYFACNESPKLSPVPKQRTVFDEAHRALWDLEALAKRSGIETSIITLKADERIIADASDFMGLDAVCINKKRQPTVDQTAD